MGQVCASDALCLPRDVARLGGVELGQVCAVVNGAEQGCAPGQRCRAGWCITAETPAADAGGDDAALDPCALGPLFGGLTEAFAEGPTAVRLRWFSAADPATPEAEMRYLIYVATASGAQDLSTATAMTTGATEHLLAGLTTGQAVHVVVRAQNLAGHVDCNRVQRSATPTPPPDCVDYPMVSPLLQSHCVRCHDGPEAPGWLRLSTYPGLLAGGAHRNTVLSCRGAESGLVLKVAADPPFGARMPADGPPFLSPAEIDLLTRFIDGGAKASCVEPSPCDDRSSPTFAGIETATITAPGRVRLGWTEASDLVTPRDRLRYDVFEAPGSRLQRFSEPPQWTVVGQSGLDLAVGPGSTLCFVVRARDLAENRESNSRELCVTAPPAGCLVEFTRDVQPILQARCVHCHQGPEPPRALSLAGYSTLLAGGALGPTVTACDASASWLVKKTSAVGCGRRMPFDGPPFLAPSEVSRLSAWVDSGARARCADPDPCQDATSPSGPTITQLSPAGTAEVELCWSAPVDDLSPDSTLSFAIWEATSTAAFQLTRPPSYSAAPGARCLRIPAPGGQRLCYAVGARDLNGRVATPLSSGCLTTPGVCLDYRHLVPGFRRLCVHCHSGPEAPLQFELDHWAGARVSNRLVRPCEPDLSRLVGAAEDCAMPDDAGARTTCGLCLSPGSTLLLRQWIREGAVETCTPGTCP